MTSAISSLTNQARKAVFALLKSRDFPPPFLMCRLFDALVTPILEYGCQLRDLFKQGTIKKFEILHRKFCKFILNVPASTTNVGIYGEFGRKPMQLRRSLFWSNTGYVLLNRSTYYPFCGNVFFYINNSTLHGWMIVAFHMFLMKCHI